MTTHSSEKLKSLLGLTAAKDHFARIVQPAQKAHSAAILGIGTGSTTDQYILALGALARQSNIPLRVVTSSRASTDLCKAQGMEVLDLSYANSLAVYIDGADEITLPSLDAIKGGGGALTKEALVGAFAPERIALVEERKVVQKLGVAYALPIEVTPDALSLVAHYLSHHTSARFTVRDAKPALHGKAITENYCHIIDATFPEGVTHEIALNIQQCKGVLSTGYFARFFSSAYIARPDGSVHIAQSNEKIVLPCWR